MLPLPIRSLPQTTARRLQAFQREIDEIFDYAQRVSIAAAKFKSRNTDRNATFRVVRETLTEMCFGAQRCCYCEDSAATQIDHHRPKSLYPDLVFVWENYVYACSGCNMPKQDRYAIFAQQTGDLLSVARSTKAPVVPPETGEVALIDPRRENPLDFMRLDIRDTFRFMPYGLPESRTYQRAKYTIEVLQLNRRDYLPLARRQAYNGYVSHLHHYMRLRDQDVTPLRLQEIVQSIQNEKHPTVWFEMKRQYQRIPFLQEVFEAIPEALQW